MSLAAAAHDQVRGRKLPRGRHVVTRLLLGVSLLAFLTSSRAVGSGSRKEVPFDSNWKFMRGDFPGAEQPGFPDRLWNTILLPHDWSIAGPFAETNATGGAGAFLPSGVGWYRKAFRLEPRSGNERVFVDFDGVMANSDVWLNGFHLGHRPNGYVSFRYELTDHLVSGEAATNVLVVRVDDLSQPASRWYSGAGIYRHVRVVVTGPVHFRHWGIFITTPAVSPDRAVVRIQTAVTNQSPQAVSAVVETTLLGPSGQVVAVSQTAPQKMSGGGSAQFLQDLSVQTPQRWELEHPELYHAVTRILRGRTVLDEQTNEFGIREAHFEAATGFWLNGVNLKLKGVCLHQDGGGVGVAVPLGVWRRRLESLKRIGCNAIRIAHNPPDPAFLRLCDRLGFLVIDEMFDCWTIGKNHYDYHLYFQDWAKVDTADTVRRDRNHPSIILYSAGNEIRDTPHAALAKGILSGLLEVFHLNDPTRPVTQALFRPNASHDYEDGFADLLDVIGQNYRENELLAAHAAQPARKILGTENGHDRRVWLALRDHAPYAGQFLWTGFDYLGESRRWPTIGAASGLFDRTGNPRPRAFQRQSWWSAAPMVYIARRLAPAAATPADPGFEPLARGDRDASDWSPSDTSPHDEFVEVFSNCQEVDLLLNGKSLGNQPLPADASPRTWRVPFEAGVLKAIGKNQGKVVASSWLQTAGQPARVLLRTDRAMLSPEWDEVAFLRATIGDSNGVAVPWARIPVNFRVSGPGILAAVDSGDNSSHELFEANSRRTYQGTCLAILRAGATSGRISVEATAQGLEPGTVSLNIGKTAPASQAGAARTISRMPLLKFQFGAGAAAPGFIRVPPDTAYTTERGYGFDLNSKVIARAVAASVPLHSGFCTSDEPFYFSVKLPEGNYDVTVILGAPAGPSETTVKAECRRLMLENIRTAPGEFVSRTFTVNIRTPKIPGDGEVRLKPRELGPPLVLHWDEKLTLEFNGSRPRLCALELKPDTNAVTVFLLGDSTVTDQPFEPWNSWGQMLPRFFKPGVAVANHAESGESLKSSWHSHRVAKVLASMKPGDYVFVQFGHNDQKDRATNALALYQENLRRLVAAVRARHGTPVLVTSMERMAGVHKDTLGGYPAAMKAVAHEQQVALIDLHAMSRVLYQALGPDLKKAFQDGTHHNAYGSYELAKCVVEGIRQDRLALAKQLVDDVPVFTPEHPDPVGQFRIPPSRAYSRVKPEGN